jgi:hypothetical protein
MLGLKYIYQDTGISGPRGQKYRLQRTGSTGPFSVFAASISELRDSFACMKPEIMFFGTLHSRI